MARRIEVSAQGAEFIRNHPPDPSRALGLGLRGLELERGDIKALEGTLGSHWRLRVAGCRVLFVYAEAGWVLRGLFAERRSIGYTVREDMIRRGWLGKPADSP